MKNKIINKKIASYFDDRGETYNRSWQSPAKKRLSRMETDLVAQAIRSAQKNYPDKPVKIVDIGIATGRIIEEILKHNVELYGIDVSSTMVEFCKKRFKGNKKIKDLAVHDILNPLPPSWEKFDVVSAIRVLSYVPNWKKEIANIYSSLKPEGMLIFTFPNKYSSTAITKFIYRKKAHGFEVVYTELKEALKEVGFSEYKVIGFARLFDSFYDWADGKVSSALLFGIEKMISLILGPILFTRMFYITCKK